MIGGQVLNLQSMQNSMQDRSTVNTSTPTILLAFVVSLLIILSIGIVAASDSSDSGISVVPIDNQITLSEEAQFNLVVRNNQDTTQTYTVYGLEVLWGIDPEQKVFIINPGDTRTIKVKVKPLGPFKPSSYSLKIFIDVSGAGSDAPRERLTRDLEIVLYPDEPMNYLPSFKVNIDMVENLDPREPLSIKLFLENSNPLDLSDMIVRIESDVPEFKKEVSVNLKPLEKKTVDLSVTPSPYQQPKMYTLFFVFERKGQQVKVLEKKIEVLPIVPEFTVTASGEQAFLRKFWQITILNPGNTLNTQEVKYPVSWFESFFTKGDVRFATLDEQRYAFWEATLNPNESAAMQLVTDYRILMYILLIILAIVGFYFYVKSPIIVNKSALATRGGEEGTLSEIKITLEIKNASNRTLKEIEVIDIIPGIANLEKSLELGTLKHHHITPTKRGTKVSWSLAEIEAHEHRIITYKVKAKLNILGTLSLPRAVVEYKKGKRSKGKAYSNVFRLG